LCFPDDDDDDDDDYLHWVRVHTVPMHLGLIDRPFVPHNLISARESPVPLSKFQMATRLKILMSSRSKKGTQIYYPFLSKVLASESPPGSPLGSPYGERCPYPEPFLTYLPGSPVKDPSPEALCTELLQRDAPFLEPTSSISQSPW